MARLFGDAYADLSDPFLRRACELAERGCGTTSPNPLVGCVLVRDSRMVGEGWHEHAGGPHAEAAALAAAGDAARGSTAYVTLEPCSHEGRTPPCAPALVRAGVRSVVIGMPDPTPLAGGGAQVLREAGLDVCFAPDAAPFEELNVEWLHFVSTGRPFLRVKVALTLDAHATLVEGVRSEITGAGARELTMRLRAATDAVVVGTGTVAVDDPALTVRDAEGRAAVRQARRVVLCRTEQPSASARMLSDGHGAVTLLLPEEVDVEPALAQAGVRAVTYPVSDGLAGAFAALGADGIVSALIEAGPRLFSALYEARLIDELVLFHSGGVAGEQAPALFVGESQEDPATLERRFRAVEAGVTEGDAVTVWRPHPETE